MKAQPDLIFALPCDQPEDDKATHKHLLISHQDTSPKEFITNGFQRANTFERCWNIVKYDLIYKHL